MRYLPDEPDKHTTRQFVADIINTLDPAYFGKLIDEIECSRGEQLKKPTQRIDVTNAMFDLLSNMTSLAASGKGPSKRSIACLKIPAKKRNRQRKEREEQIF